MMPFSSRLALGAVLLAGAAQAPDAEPTSTAQEGVVVDCERGAREALERELAALLRERRSARLQALPLAGGAASELVASLSYQRRLEDLARRGSAAAALRLRLESLAAAPARSGLRSSNARADAWAEILREALREPRLWEPSLGLLRTLEAEGTETALELARRLDAGELGERSTPGAHLARATLHAPFDPAGAGAPAGARLSLAEPREDSLGADLLEPYASDLAWRREHLALGRQAPELVTYDVDGNEIRTADLLGRVLVIDFWSFDEPGLSESLASRRRVAALARTGAIELIGIGLEPEAATHRRIADELEMDWTSSWEAGADGAAARAWRIRAAPASVVLDPAGRIRFVGVPGAELERALEQLCSELGRNPRGVKGHPIPGRGSEVGPR